MGKWLDFNDPDDRALAAELADGDACAERAEMHRTPSARELEAKAQRKAAVEALRPLLTNKKVWAIATGGGGVAVDLTIDEARILYIALKEKANA